jgi:hypothetical protein
MNSFLLELRKQRWDDHRYYHHSRVNQSLHFVSALGFLLAYFLLFSEPVAAGLVGWLFAMVSRQVGHFFFEPKGYDAVNQATHEYKESVKVGYNLRRKIVLLSIWAVSPIALWLDPTMFGLLVAHTGTEGFLRNLSMLWIAVGITGALFRTVQLCYLRDLRTGLAWLTKILTDPIHDIRLYHGAPVRLLHGELIDPMVHGNHG